MIALWLKPWHGYARSSAGADCTRIPVDLQIETEDFDEALQSCAESFPRLWFVFAAATATHFLMQKLALPVLVLALLAKGISIHLGQ